MLKELTRADWLQILNLPDSRTPAVWISNGTGRDGAGNRNAPKVGWCWADNRHSWLGFASAASRIRLTVQAPA